MNLDLTDDEAAALLRELDALIDGDRYFLSQRIQTLKAIHDVDPQAWLADVLRRIADHPASKLDELLPWNWKKSQAYAAAA